MSTYLKDEQMQFQVEPDLKAAFYKAAALSDRSAAQVLQELMRNFVEDILPAATLPTSADSPATDQQNRSDAVRFARASVALEGFHVDSATTALMQRYIDGELTIQDCIKAIDDTAKG